MPQFILKLKVVSQSQLSCFVMHPLYLTQPIRKTSVWQLAIIMKIVNPD